MAIAEDAAREAALIVQHILQLDEEFQISHIYQQGSPFSQSVNQSISHLAKFKSMDTVPSWKGGRWFYY